MYIYILRVNNPALTEYIQGWCVENNDGEQIILPYYYHEMTQIAFCFHFAFHCVIDRHIKNGSHGHLTRKEDKEAKTSWICLTYYK